METLAGNNVDLTWNGMKCRLIKCVNRLCHMYNLFVYILDWINVFSQKTLVIDFKTETFVGAFCSCVCLGFVCVCVSGGFWILIYFFCKAGPLTSGIFLQMG